MNKDKFKEIFDLHFDAIRNYIFYRISDEETAQDIAQEVFMQVWKKRDVLDETHIKSLLFKMASDSVVSHYRKTQVHLNFTKNIVFSEIDDHSPDKGIEYQDLVRKYNKALSSMSEEQRSVFLMSREESLKYSEIAERLNLSVKAIEKRMSGALKILKENIIYLIVWILITLK